MAELSFFVVRGPGRRVTEVEREIVTEGARFCVSERFCVSDEIKKRRKVKNK